MCGTKGVVLSFLRQKWGYYYNYLSKNSNKNPQKNLTPLGIGALGSCPAPPPLKKTYKQAKQKTTTGPYYTQIRFCMHLSCRSLVSRGGGYTPLLPADCNSLLPFISQFTPIPVYTMKTPFNTLYPVIQSCIS